MDEYFSFLLAHDLGMFTSEPERFPDIEMTWDRPEHITNAIVDIDRLSSHDYNSIFKQLDALGCGALQLRVFDVLALAKLKEILTAANGQRLRHLDLVVAYSEECNEDALTDLAKVYPLIAQIVVHSSPFAMRRDLKPHPSLIVFITEGITADSCGQVAPEMFSLGIEHFVEAHSFNSCLNRKLGIDTRGYIRACPSMPQALGHTSTITLVDAAASTLLQRMSRTTKDSIKVCQECEFRYICTDCRAHLSDPCDDLSKPAKCTYDPYTATWASSPVIVATPDCMSGGLVAISTSTNGV